MTVETKSQRGLFWYPGCSDHWWVPADWMIYKFDCFLSLAQGFIGYFLK